MSKRQLQSLPSIFTFAVHQDPISPFGSRFGTAEVNWVLSWHNSLFLVGTLRVHNCSSLSHKWNQIYFKVWLEVELDLFHSSCFSINCFFLVATRAELGALSHCALGLDKSVFPTSVTIARLWCRRWVLLWRSKLPNTLTLAQPTAMCGT